MKYWILYIFIYFSVINPGFAKKIIGNGEYTFGPSISKNDGCLEALMKARIDAIRRYSGIRISSEEIEVCQEGLDKMSCMYHSHQWSHIEDNIGGEKILKREVKSKGEFDICVVKIKLNIKKSKKRLDPEFDFTVALNSRSFTEGNNLYLDLKPNQPMYINIFQWQPYRKGINVRKIFPTKNEGNFFKAQGRIPKKGYNFEATFPEELSYKRKEIDTVVERLMIVATKENIKFMDQYTYSDFRSRLIEIKANKKRLKPIAYTISKFGE